MSQTSTPVELNDVELDAVAGGGHGLIVRLIEDGAQRLGCLRCEYSMGGRLRLPCSSSQSTPPSQDGAKTLGGQRRELTKGGTFEENSGYAASRHRHRRLRR
jgi:hypothetical protein